MITDCGFRIADLFAALVDFILATRNPKQHE